MINGNPSLFTEILASNRRSSILNMAETALPTTQDKEGRIALQRILDANNLDEIHILAAEMCGEFELAAKIRNSRVIRDARPALSLG